MTMTNMLTRLRRGAAIAPLVGALALAGCETLTVPDYNNPGLGDVQEDPSRTNILLAAQGLQIGARTGMSATAGYVSSLGILGRESYNFDPSDPRFLTGLLVGPLDGSSNAFGGAHWVPRYANIRNANILLDILDAAAGEVTTEEAEAIRGWARTLQAHDYLLAINTRDDIGAPIMVSGDPTADPAPIASKPEVLTYVLQLLDEGADHLDAGGASFPFQVSSGFAGFDTPASFREFNRALRARVQAYREDWTGVLNSLTESFINDDPGQTVDDLRVGVYHAFSSQPGDVTNGLFDPSHLILLAHPSVVADAQAGDARLARKVIEVAEVDDQAGAGVSSAWAYNIYDRLSSPIPFIKNEELILLRAEANLQLGNTALALDDINLVRQASGNLPALTTGDWNGRTAEQRIDELLYNRRYSLMFEGHRWIDTRRYDRLMNLPIDAGTNFVRFSRFPFPVRECDARVPPPSQGCAQELGF